MTRLVSLGVILGLVAVFGLLSLRVMSGFLLPLLLAAMLVTGSPAVSRVGGRRADHALCACACACPSFFTRGACRW